MDSNIIYYIVEVFSYHFIIHSSELLVIQKLSLWCLYFLFKRVLVNSLVIHELQNFADADPSSYTGKIVECSFDLDKGVWVFMRVRTDKDTPNAYNTYLQVHHRCSTWIVLSSCCVLYFSDVSMLITNFITLHRLSKVSRTI